MKVFATLFGRRVESGSQTHTAKEEPQSEQRFGNKPHSDIPEEVSDYLRRQEIFLQSIGPHMRHGVAFMISHGEISHEFVTGWNVQIENITSAERGQLLVDWAHWRSLRAPQSVVGIAPKDRHPNVLPFAGNQHRLPTCIYNGSILQQDIQFTEIQAKQFLDRLLAEGELGNDHFTLRTTNRLTTALRKAIKTPDENLASRIRNGKRNLKWAAELLDLLCPFEAATPALETIAIKEEQAVFDTFRHLLLAFRRLPGMWVQVPAQIDSYWGRIDHQMVPFLKEIDGCAKAVQLALQAGHDVFAYRNYLLALRDVARINLEALKSNRGNICSLDDLARTIPAHEKARVENPYWWRPNAEADKVVFDTLGRPRLDLILELEKRWLSEFEIKCNKMEAMQPKQGLAKKMSELLPTDAATAPTKTWLKKAVQILDREDLTAIVRDISGPTPPDPTIILNTPGRPFEDYEVALLAARVFRAKVWAAHLLGAEAAEPLYNLAQKCYKKVPGVGPADTKLGNSAAISLSLIGNGAGVPYLLHLQRDVEYPTIKAFLEKRMAETATHKGPSVQDIKEMAAKDHGFA
jgi:hypothetical protein